jgi:hypothetical protein
MMPLSEIIKLGSEFLSETYLRRDFLNLLQKQERNLLTLSLFQTVRPLIRSYSSF